MGADKEEAELTRHYEFMFALEQKTETEHFNKMVSFKSSCRFFNTKEIKNVLIMTPI